MTNDAKNIAKAFGSFDESRAAIKEFLETKPLYVKLKVPLPHSFSKIYPESLFLHCSVCNGDRPFRDERPRGSGAPSRSGVMVTPEKFKTSIYYFTYTCTHCRAHNFYCWVYIDTEKEELFKVGQYPMWLPKIPKDIETELGEDAEIYQKALRNMNEGYGIGACAYLRRLIEKYINPLLQLLYEMKQESGAGDDELKAIKDAITSKDFTSKTKFAADIAPLSILVEGHNPLKEIHERLSVGLHTLDDETANEYAAEIRTALEFIIRNLRRTHNERKAYAAQIKKIRKLSTDNANQALAKTE
jgi:hypothetical protein